MNIFKLVKEDIEDIVLIYKCAFRALGDTNPITQVTRMRNDRLKRNAKVLPHDFERPSHWSPEYVEYYRKMFDDGEIEKVEYQFERAHHKMRFSNWFFCRTVSYAVVLFFAIPVAATLLIGALMT